MPKIKPIGHKKMYSLIWNDKMDGDDAEMHTNKRAAHCKVCGRAIPRGDGFYWRRYADGDPNNIRFTRNYLCAECQAIWGNLSPRKIKIWGKEFIRYFPRAWSNGKIKDVLGFEIVEPPQPAPEPPKP